MILGFVGNIIKEVSKPDACDCMDLMNRERMIGFGNLIYDKKKHITNVLVLMIHLIKLKASVLMVFITK